MPQPMWTPSEDRAAATLLKTFMAKAEAEQSVPLPDYDTLWQWSVDHKASFWSEVWDFCELVGDRGKDVLVGQEDLIAARFFPDSKINFAENMLRKTGPEAAIIFRSENGERVEWSWDRLHATVSRIQQALIDQGVGVGDRVAGFVPNRPETVAAMLATAALGAVWSSCSPDFGFNGVIDRFGQIEPKVMFCADAYHYNGKVFSSVDTAGKLAEAMPSVSQIIVIPYVEPRADISALGDKGVHLEDLLQRYDEKGVAYTRVPFGSPLYIMFSSGTTGLPKCIVHSVGGTLIQHLKEHMLHCDVKPHDRMMYFTTCGWMMWNWMVSALGCNATLVLFDGSPFYPDGNILADIVASEAVTHFGTSAKYIDACSKADVCPIESHDLSALRTILSTGSPLAPEGFDYIYANWKADVCLSSIAGGTDIIACFLVGSPISPVYRGECQKRSLGLDVQVYDDAGNALQGEPGDLVCAGPHPSMPIGFWNDPDGSRYRAAYFEKYPNVWHHGDWVVLTETGGMIFYGRSDAVLNPGGVRIGTAEIYRQVEHIDEVLEGVVIGQQWDNDVRVVLFVKLREGVTLDDDLVKRIKAEIRANTTPRHVPAKVIQVADIPRTKSGKVTELAVRDIVHGRAVKNTEALANPQALDLFRDIPELQT